MPRAFIYLVVFLGLQLAGRGQEHTGFIKLRAVNKTNQDPIRDTLYLCFNPGQKTYRLLPDSDGLAQLRFFEPGRYSLKASATGYLPAHQKKVIVNNIHTTYIYLKFRPIKP